MELTDKFRYVVYLAPLQFLLTTSFKCFMQKEKKLNYIHERDGNQSYKYSIWLNSAYRITGFVLSFGVHCTTFYAL